MSGLVSGLGLLFVFCLFVFAVSVGQMRNAPGTHFRLIVAQFALALAQMFLCRVFTRLSNGLTNRC